MQNNPLKRVVFIIVPTLFWLAFWEISSLLISNPYFLPGIPETFSALFKLLSYTKFYKVVLSSLFRVITGIVLGSILGVLLALLSHKSSLAKSIISPVISIIKATPVATFIIILWVMLDGRALPVFIAVMMVMPIIWQNIMDAFSSIPAELTEVCAVFEFSFSKKFRLLVFPALLKFFVPAIITASGLAWKSEIAAEIIAYTKNSIGQYITDAKNFYDTPSVFAWTIVIILLSILMETLTKYLLRRFKA